MNDNAEKSLWICVITTFRMASAEEDPTVNEVELQF
jgi:hypothetical protein